MEENLKKIRELMVSSQFEAGIELALTIDDKYLILELVDGCKIREDGTVTLKKHLPLMQLKKTMIYWSVLYLK